MDIKKIIILICFCLLILGCKATNEDCIDAVKKDYGYKNPTCRGWWSNYGGNVDCECYEQVCRENTCVDKNYVKFDIKNE